MTTSSPAKIRIRGNKSPPRCTPVKVTMKDSKKYNDIHVLSITNSIVSKSLPKNIKFRHVTTERALKTDDKLFKFCTDISLYRVYG